jgi:arginyl-tRNA synthetase
VYHIPTQHTKEIIGSLFQVCYNIICLTSLFACILKAHTMKSIIQECLYESLRSLAIPADIIKGLALPIEYSRIEKHGDFSSNVALVLAQSLHTNPMALAQKITNQLQVTSTKKKLIFQKVEAMTPGFINFFIHPDAWLDELPAIFHQGNQYGTSDFGKQQRVLVEFVSSNPTGPLHIGHGRAAAQGDILARLLKALGYQVHTEYYINDAGRQVDILACSIWLRYLEHQGEALPFPDNAYQGDYIRALATELHKHYGRAFYRPAATVIEAYPGTLDAEQFIDAVISRAKTLLGSEQYARLREFGVTHITQDIKEDLSEFGVHFDTWFSENSLLESGEVASTIHALTQRGHTYKADGNLWFRSTVFGDDKDRVLLRANGQPTYFAVDAAYRINILQTRRFDTIINLLGADHHGYLARIRAVVQALGYSKNTIAFSTLQMVSLYRGQKKLPLSTRRGDFITLRALRQEVGSDVARLFFVLRKSNQPIDFDLELAKSESHQNPVYYLQYAYARIASLMRQLQAKGLEWNLREGLNNIKNLALAEEIQLIKQLVRYPDVLLQAAAQCEPAVVVQYLRELAKHFHAYYNHTPVLTQTNTIRNGRITLIQATQQVLKNGFTLLGIQILEKM